MTDAHEGHSHSADASTAASDAREILIEVEALLRETFALEAWGRLLVFMRPAAEGTSFSAKATDAYVVEDLQVEDIVDDAMVERVFNGREIHGGLAALATATVTLALLEDVDIGEVGGGTFVRVVDASGKTERVAFLPAPVRTPSRAFDAARDGAVLEMARRSRGLAEELGVEALNHLSFDAHASTFAAPNGKTGRAIALGSFSDARRSWAWASNNPSLPEPAQKAARDMIDAFADRSLWEVSTHGFFTDRDTAWALASVVTANTPTSGLARAITRDGFVIFALQRDASS